MVVVEGIGVVEGVEDVGGVVVPLPPPPVPTTVLIGPFST